MRFAIAILVSLTLILSSTRSSAQSPINPNNLSDADQEALATYIQECEVTKYDKADLQKALDDRKFMSTPSVFKSDEALIGGAILMFVTGYMVHQFMVKP